MLKKLYQKFYNNKNFSAARQIIRELLVKNNGNVSKTARELGVSRKTVRRARDGTLNNLPKAPKNPKNKISDWETIAIISEAKKLKTYGYRKLTRHFEKKYGIKLPPHRVRYVLKKNGFSPSKSKRKRSASHTPLYNYSSLLPFQEIQIDTKYIKDKSALTTEGYQNITRYNLPLYQWTAVDAATRIKFTAFSYSLSVTYGLTFITMVVLWLRAHNVRHNIRIRVDNGSEFTSGSIKKLLEINEFLSQFGAELYTNPPGAKWHNAIVENLHRKDDEYFYIPLFPYIKDTRNFLLWVRIWQDVWNTRREHNGINMKGKTPFEKLRSLDLLINPNVVNYPVILFETLFAEAYNEIMRMINFNLTTLLKHPSKGGTYVVSQCQWLHYSKI